MTLIDPAGPEIHVGDAAQAAIKTIDQRRKEGLSFEDISKIIRADFETGKLYWLRRTSDMFANGKRDAERACISWNARFAGKEALTADNGFGYRHGDIFAKKYQAHRVIWLLAYGEWPEDQIDHINGNRSDNRLSNLSAASNLTNGKNQKRPSDNTSGHIGVCWSKRHQKWMSQIHVNGRGKFLGYFDEIQDAVAARKKAEATFGFHENHGRSA